MHVWVLWASFSSSFKLTHRHCLILETTPASDLSLNGHSETTSIVESMVNIASGKNGELKFNRLMTDMTVVKFTSFHLSFG